MDPLVQNYNEPPASHRLPGLPADLKRVYDGLQKLGATAPSAGRPVARLSKDLHIPKKEMLHDLHVLEGKGIVGHQTSGSETSWYCRK